MNGIVLVLDQLPRMVLLMRGSACPALQRLAMHDLSRQDVKALQLEYPPQAVLTRLRSLGQLDRELSLDRHTALDFQSLPGHFVTLAMTSTAGARKQRLGIDGLESLQVQASINQNDSQAL